MGRYVADGESGYYIDSEITASGLHDRLAQEGRFGKLRFMNSSRKPGRDNEEESDHIEANVEFVGVGFYDDGDIGIEVRVISGKCIKPGDEVFFVHIRSRVRRKC